MTCCTIKDCHNASHHHKKEAKITFHSSSLSASASKITCDCPSAVPFDKLAIKPQYRTPIDRFGFPLNCCFCCSTRVASGFICVMSFLWAAIELQCVDKTMSGIFPKRGDVFYYCKMVYLFICLGFLMACASLLLGVCMRKLRPVHCFVWYGFLFNMISVTIAIAVTVCRVLNTGGITALQTVKIVMAVIWWMVFMYLLMVVNSYKLKVWYRTLGFGL